MHRQNNQELDYGLALPGRGVDRILASCHQGGTVMKKRMAWLVFAALLSTAAVADVEFRVDCRETARDDFDHALGLMHHMMYEQARTAFEAVGEADPDCAMAHWGIATTLFQPLWGTRPDAGELERGWRLSQRAAELAASDRERSLIDATAGFFRDPDSAAFATRIERWIDGMAAAHDAHADDPDVAALYALSLLTRAQRSDDRDRLLDEAEAVLRRVFDRHPTHPGAIHYTIHATDADGRAGNALDIVAAYGEIAPDVTHALHMPSHIHVRLGDWPEVIDWNRRSAEAALRHPVGDALSHHYIHAIDYMVYAWLQQGEVEQARAVWREAQERGRYQPSFISAYHLAAIPARIAVEQRDWSAAVALAPRTPDYLPWDAARWAEAQTWYARGLGAVHSGDGALAREAEARLVELREAAEADGEAAFATYIEIDRKVLSGWIAHGAGRDDEAVSLMRAAADLEGRIEKHPVSPGALLPPNEALGELLLEMERADEARAAFDASLERWPGRANSLHGIESNVPASSAGR